MKLVDWKVARDSEEANTFLDDVRYEITLTGSDLDLDERSKWIKESVEKVSSQRLVTRFSFPEAEISFGDDKARVFEIENLSLPSGNILLDATSLSFPEILYSFLWAKTSGRGLDVLYAEPSAYTSSEKDDGDILSRRFELSEDGPGVNFLPRFTARTPNSRLVVALGFEGHRVGALLESDEFQNPRFTGLFGIPPFVPGWERVTFKENSKQMERALKQLDGEFKIAGANDPYNNFKILTQCHAAEEGRGAMHPSRRLLLAPFGTKPVAVSMAWFAVMQEDVGVIYDFLKKKRKRTQGIGKIHVWQFSPDSY